MWHDLFLQQLPWTEKVLRTVLVYALLVVLFRITGKRGLASMNTFDVVVVFLLGNVVQNAVIGNDDSVTGATIGAVTLVAVNALVNRLTTGCPLAQRLFEGTPTTVIDHGRVLPGALPRLGRQRAELEHAVRLQNGDDVAQVDHGALEPGGQLLLTLRDDEQGATKADVDRLLARLAHLEELLVARPAPPAASAG